MASPKHATSDLLHRQKSTTCFFFLTVSLTRFLKLIVNYVTRSLSQAFSSPSFFTIRSLFSLDGLLISLSVLFLFFFHAYLYMKLFSLSLYGLLISPSHHIYSRPKIIIVLLLKWVCFGLPPSFRPTLSPSPPLAYFHVPHFIIVEFMILDCLDKVLFVEASLNPQPLNLKSDSILQTTLS